MIGTFCLRLTQIFRIKGILLATKSYVFVMKMRMQIRDITMGIWNEFWGNWING